MDIKFQVHQCGLVTDYERGEGLLTEALCDADVREDLGKLLGELCRKRSRTRDYRTDGAQVVLLYIGMLHDRTRLPLAGCRKV